MAEFPELLAVLTNWPAGRVPPCGRPKVVNIEAAASGKTDVSAADAGPGPDAASHGPEAASSPARTAARSPDPRALDPN
jgi:hypothetical protein